MKNLIKSLILSILLIVLIEGTVFQTSAANLSPRYQNLANTYADKIEGLLEKKDINIEVFIAKLDNRIESGRYSGKVLLLVEEINKILKEISCNIYPIHKDVITTVFWIGEEENASNAYISNNVSAWDENWVNHMLEGKENSFYFALPYNDFDNYGKRRTNAKNIPRYGLKDWSDMESIVKNKWIKVSYNGKTIYTQWEDVGPLEENDFDYVFGDENPKNTFSLKAGLDLSPEAADYLGIGLSKKVNWNFVPSYCVPSGDWKKQITSSGITWY